MAGAAVQGSVVLRLAVTTHTPAHRQAGTLKNFGHLRDLPVTSCTVFAGFNVHGVIELHVIGKQSDFLPRNGFSRVVSFREFLDPRIVHFHDHMTVHADVERRHRSVTGNFRAGVTVFAINLVLARVQFVGKRNRLIGFITLVVTNHDFIIGERPDKNAEAEKTDDNDGSEELFRHSKTLCIDITVGCNRGPPMRLVYFQLVLKYLN